MRNALPSIAGLVTLSLTLSATAFAQAPTTYPGGAARPPVGQGDAEHRAGAASESDAAFLQKAASDGQAEIELADLASKQSQNAAVKTFASQIKSDHTKAAADVKRLAGAKHVSLAPKPVADETSPKARLVKMSGAAFDMAYADEMVTAHQQAIDLFTTACESTDAEVKAFANKTLPVLQEHLRHAQDLQKSLGGATKP